METTLTLSKSNAALVAHYLKKGAMEEASWMKDFPDDYSKEQREKAAQDQARAIGYAEFLLLEK